MNNGWVKIHRAILDKGFYKRSAYVHLWLHLLLNVNHEPKEFMWNGNIVLIKEGQMITGRKELSAQTGIPESTIEDILKFLETQHQIQQQKTTKYRLITIVNWIKHQKSDSKSNNRATTEQQQADTNKNVRSIRIKEEEYPEPSSGAFIDLFKAINPTYQYLFSRNNQRDACKRLLKLRSLEEWQKVIGFISSRRSDKFCPRISTPIQLEQKYAELESYATTLKVKSRLIL